MSCCSRRAGIAAILLLALTGGVVAQEDAAPDLRAERALGQLELVRPDAPVLGAQWPDFRLNNQEGKKKRRSDFLGQVTVFTFLKEGQLETIAAMPEVNRLTVLARQNGLEHILVFPQVRRKAVNKFGYHKGVAAHSLVDRKGKLWRFLGEPELPYHVVTDQDMTVRYAATETPPLITEQ
jgi:hypothetical protein